MGSFPTISKVPGKGFTGSFILVLWEIFGLDSSWISGNSRSKGSNIMSRNSWHLVNENPSGIVFRISDIHGSITTSFMSINSNFM